ncbi:hypothetical protein AWB90_07070 [Mycobacterium paraense]|uniref:PE domain-containing protein n=1 Tax=Mycobacterium paraense TaxID=767916 RepID=A0A1X2AFY7_9MYCO|nr:PE family protein [Mycobacterium paraense]ORW50301.1 hypothetical protein AWB90_07070 [Mycobacterium paraense]
MSSLNVMPEMVSAASGNLQNLGSALRSANAAAASQTTAIAAPAADEVSSAISAALGAHGQEFQAISAQAATFHDEFVNLLSGGAAQYLNAEAANVQQVAAAVVTPTTTPDTPPNGFGAINLNYPFGPFGVSLSSIPTFYANGDLSLISSGAVTYNLPLGSGVLASVSANQAIIGNAFYGYAVENFPLGAWVSFGMTGFFNPYPQLSTLMYNFDGLEFSVPGTGLLGPFVPNVTWNPNP